MSDRLARPIPGDAPQSGPGLERYLPRNEIYPGAVVAHIGAICRITHSRHNKILHTGTGFLVSARHVLTAAHVLRGYVAIDEVICEFEPFVPHSAERHEVEELCVSSPHCESDVTGAAGPSNATDKTLDFALIKLRTSARRIPVALTAGVAASMGVRIVVCQHPEGGRAAFSVGHVVETLAFRVRYNASTRSGSSGGPCFDEDGTLVALHHAGDPAEPPTFNQGIPIGPIARACTPHLLGAALTAPPEGAIPLPQLPPQPPRALPPATGAQPELRSSVSAVVRTRDLRALTAIMSELCLDQFDKFIDDAQSHRIQATILWHLESFKAAHSTSLNYVADPTLRGALQRAIDTLDKLLAFGNHFVPDSGGLLRLDLDPMKGAGRTRARYHAAIHDAKLAMGELVALVRTSWHEVDLTETSAAARRARLGQEKDSASLAVSLELPPDSLDSPLSDEIADFRRDRTQESPLVQRKPNRTQPPAPKAASNAILRRTIVVGALAALLVGGGLVTWRLLRNAREEKHDDDALYELVVLGLDGKAARVRAGVCGVDLDSHGAGQFRVMGECVGEKLEAFVDGYCPAVLSKNLRVADSPARPYWTARPKEIRVVDRNKQPMPGALITVGQISYAADEDGRLALDEMCNDRPPAGMAVIINGERFDASLEDQVLVADNYSAPPFSFLGFSNVSASPRRRILQFEDGYGAPHTCRRPAAAAAICPIAAADASASASLATDTSAS